MHGWYQTSLPWKGNHPTLPTNKMGSKKRLENDLYEEYNSIIEEQLLQGIVEAAPGVRGAGISIIGGADIHIFVFCPINFF